MPALIEDDYAFTVIVTLTAGGGIAEECDVDCCIAYRVREGRPAIIDYVRGGEPAEGAELEWLGPPQVRALFRDGQNPPTFRWVAPDPGSLLAEAVAAHVGRDGFEDEVIDHALAHGQRVGRAA